jgi:GR25 family glycosyltransferase involved in LPS biosynthesis
MKFKIDNAFYINLDISADRRKNCEKQFTDAGIEAVRWPGLDARALTPQAIDHILEKNAPEFLHVKDRNRNWGEECCILSHVLILKHIVSNNLENTLIVEDDFVFCRKFDSFIVFDETNILFLTKRVYFDSFESLNARENSDCIQANAGCGTEGYWIPNAESATKILNVWLSDGIKVGDLKLIKAAKKGIIKAFVLKNRIIEHDVINFESVRK